MISTTPSTPAKFTTILAGRQKKPWRVGCVKGRPLLFRRVKRTDDDLKELVASLAITQKETDLIAPYLTAGKTFYDIPWEIVQEYGIADVKATEEIALKQLDAFGVTFEELFDGKGTRTHTEAIA